ncbi:MAG: YbdD/YjiX family protein [Pseudomonadales bacterium]|jgi:uncharacterized short protein YbdD (DUF466 family)|nr:YbdD/YjiX family protein [Pseudomonadales bacterium]MCP5333787.1 YbdD/YjiX family protein [Pseudomonadales bacterium]HMU90339.1 YbdD/YjiX family protein [Pseudomonadales bacterium]HMW14158.1 YbdD/YjiX family protein [Pseudomonadales bacterium]HMW84036.1 YbdD/YjiX family protein [Pseudomonadales bacterium]
MQADDRKTEGRIARCWAAVRQWSGDDAYERYLAHQRLAHPDAAPLDRRAFHRHYQQQRFSGVNRCC